MAIPSGTKLGSYEVVAQIGAGGMGEVYQAHDTKLGRDVAIKVLPEVFAHDPQRLSRFQREAKLLASLNHPNIATIHGLEESNGTHYLVMELVPGETLRERVKREGALPVEEALGIAKQIAEALEAAHEKSIIHRDLKPANVKVTPEGKVKVLDFGLAKAFASEESGSDPSNSPTLSQAATLQGVILGTAAYMSPEQARGKTPAIDKRTDIWAFGCVLYELLTGKQAFVGETATDIIAKVLQQEPDWQGLPPGTPTKIHDLLRRCLQKDKTLRLRDAGDARIEIQETLTAPALAPPRVVASGLGGWRLPVVEGLAALAVAAVAAIATWFLKPAPTALLRPVSRTVINLPPGDQLAALDYPAIAISPDGTQLVYVAIHSGTRQIFLRALDTLEVKPLAGTEGGNTPFFSPDGQWVGFFAGGELKKVSVSGGAAVPIGDASNPFGASWSSQGTIAFAPTNISTVRQVQDTGGASQPMTRFGKGEVSHRWPEFLPSGKAMLFASGPTGITFINAQVAVQAIGAIESRNLIQGGTNPRYAPSGHLIYARGGSLMAVPFDPQRLAVRGAEVPVVEGTLESSVGASQYSISGTGTLVYVPGGFQSAQTRLVWVNRNGAEQPLAAPAHAYFNPQLSPDGRRVAVGILEQESQIWVYDLSRDTLTRFTLEGNYNPVSVWTRDGKRITFESNKEGTPNLFWQSADGSGGLERLTNSEYLQAPMSWSPDGQVLAFDETNPTTGLDIWVLRRSDHKAQPFLRTQFNEAIPRFSPDGHWLAYISDESGRYEVYVQPYPGPGGKYQISTEGGTEPAWNPNGKELFYRSGDKMMAVDIARQPNFSAGKARMLFEGRYELAPVRVGNYDVSPDGQRFLMVKPSGQAQSVPTQINVVLNWFEELKQKVPAGKK